MDGSQWPGWNVAAFLGSNQSMFPAVGQGGFLSSSNDTTSFSSPAGFVNVRYANDENDLKVQSVTTTNLILNEVATIKESLAFIQQQQADTAAFLQTKIHSYEKLEGIIENISKMKEEIEQLTKGHDLSAQAIEAIFRTALDKHGTATSGEIEKLNLVGRKSREEFIDTLHEWIKKWDEFMVDMIAKLAKNNDSLRLERRK